MKVEHSPSLRVGLCVWPRAQDAWGLTVVCKASYRYEPGECVLLPEPEPLYDSDVRRGGDGHAGVIRPADLVPFKSSTDVVVTGDAYAPPSHTEQSLVVGLSLGSIDKRLKLIKAGPWSHHDDRQRAAPLSAPLSAYPLDYAYAAGGAETDNPVGMSAAYATDGGDEVVALPPLQPLGFNGVEGRWPEPVGLGPIAADWPSRQAYLREGDVLAAQQWMARPLATDFDYRYFNAAPADQRLAEVKPTMPLTLWGLHPTHAELSVPLPSVFPRVAIEQGTSEIEELETLLRTLHIDSRRQRLHLVWYAAVISAKEPQLRRVVIEHDVKVPRVRVAGFSPGTDRSPARSAFASPLPIEHELGPSPEVEAAASVWDAIPISSSVPQDETAAPAPHDDLFPTRRMRPQTHRAITDVSAVADPWGAVAASGPAEVEDERTSYQAPFVDTHHTTADVSDAQVIAQPLPFARDDSVRNEQTEDRPSAASVPDALPFGRDKSVKHEQTEDRPSAAGVPDALPFGRDKSTDPEQTEDRPSGAGLRDTRDALPFREGTFRPVPEAAHNSGYEETGGHTAAVDIHALRALRRDSATPFQSEPPGPPDASPPRPVEAPIPAAVESSAGALGPAAVAAPAGPPPLAVEAPLMAAVEPPPPLAQVASPQPAVMRHPLPAKPAKMAPIAPSSSPGMSPEQPDDKAAEVDPGPWPIPLDTYAAIKATVWRGTALGDALSERGIGEGLWRDTEKQVSATLTAKDKTSRELSRSIRQALRKARKSQA